MKTKQSFSINRHGHKEFWVFLWCLSCLSVRVLLVCVFPFCECVGENQKPKEENLRVFCGLFSGVLLGFWVREKYCNLYFVVVTIFHIVNIFLDCLLIIPVVFLHFGVPRKFSSH